MKESQCWVMLRYIGLSHFTWIMGVFTCVRSNWPGSIMRANPWNTIYCLAKVLWTMPDEEMDIVHGWIVSQYCLIAINIYVGPSQTGVNYWRRLENWFTLFFNVTIFYMTPTAIREIRLKSIAWEFMGGNLGVKSPMFVFIVCYDPRIRRHALYSMDDEPSDVLKLSPTRKKSRPLSFFILSSHKLAK